MEEFLLALAQFLLEVLFPLIVEIFVNFVAEAYWPTGKEDKSPYLLLITVSGLLGAASGFVPPPISNHPIVQVFVVIAGPWMIAILAERAFRQREASGKPRPAIGSFWKIYWFAFPFLLARSVIIHHQSIRSW